MRIQQAQTILGYNFKRVDHLDHALTAAGVNEDDHDGNRRLAQLGAIILQMVLLDNAYMNGDSRNVANLCLSLAATKNKRASLAKSLGIDRLIKCCPRQTGQPPSKATLSLTFSAIVGAVWVDSEHNFSVLSHVLKQLW
ncbi:MAG: hypothetical protein M1825_004061 [Sarcosagium campestre]|nr:MAG: hypothetical protein M1825_004061 [Sarcosagium campestre]